MGVGGGNADARSVLDIEDVRKEHVGVIPGHAALIAFERDELPGGEGDRRVGRGDRDIALIERAGAIQRDAGLAGLDAERRRTAFGADLDVELQNASIFCRSISAVSRLAPVDWSPTGLEPPLSDVPVWAQK